MNSRPQAQARWKAMLVLRDGSFFVGSGFGARRKAVGELVFNTSMTGYQEALTDPSYAGQILTFSYPLIGNYGISESAFESKRAWVRACVVREACDSPVHFQSKKTIHQFLEEQDVPGIAGVDTRAIVKRVRGSGVMPAVLAPLDAEDENNIIETAAKLAGEAQRFDYGGHDFVKETATKQVVFEGNGRRTVVLIDCGAKASIAKELNAVGFRVAIVPPDTSAKDILALEPVGVMSSNGPGDPATVGYTISSLKGLLGKVPIFGICLGHQLLAHALGGKTFKLKFGHRGGNQPVKELRTGRVFITSQNHGYAATELPKDCEEWFVNANDGTNEGLKHKNLPVMSVQYHPEANPGPYDSRYLFTEFKKMVGD